MRSNNPSTIQLNIKNNLGQNIAGILEKKSQDTLGEKLGIICHGVVGHEDYLFHAELAKGLPFDNFRFDFRGNGKSDGTPKFSNFQADVEDIDAVVKYLEKEFGYKLYAAIGHSKGSISVLTYACYVNRNVPHVINISARYHKPSALLRFKKSDLDLMRDQGYFYWDSKHKGNIRVDREDFDKYFNYDMFFVRKMPETTSVLTCHGIADEVVPVEDAAFYANLIKNHTLELIPGANHNYNNKHKELIEVINQYFSNDFQSMEFLERYLHISGIPRHIFVDGVSNFRDLGGFECNLGKLENGKQDFIRERFIFRCANLSKITDDGIATLRRLNVQKVFDLRSIPEIVKFGAKDIEGIIRVHAPVYKDEDYSPEALFKRWDLYTRGVEGYSQAYMGILEQGKKAYYEIFKHILEYPTRPFIVHCTAGKDRTGVFAMLVFKLLGINDEIIAREYELTHVNTKVIDPIKIKLYKKAMNNKYDEDEIRDMFGAKYESMVLSLRNFHNHYKSADNYLLQCGFNMREIEIIKNNLRVTNNQNNIVVKSLL